MNYDLIVVKIGKPQIKQVLARHLASDPSVSLQKALSLLDNLPVVYMKDLSTKELKEAAGQLNKLGVECRAVESKGPPDSITPKKSPPAKEVFREKDSSREKRAVQEKRDPAPVPRPDTPPDSNIKMKRSVIQGGGGPVTFSSTGSQGEPGSGKKEPEKKKKAFVNMLIVAGVLIAAVLFFVIGKKKNYDIQSTSPFVSKSGKGIAPGTGSDGNGAPQRREQKEHEEAGLQNKQPSAGTAQRKSSEAYADSAVSVEDDYDRAIKFYKIAISFNQYNLRAWHGLIAAYTNANMVSEALEARKRMEELFDDTVLTVEKIVEPYGKLSQYNREKGGTCRIEYRSRTKKRSRIEKETYSLIRELISQQGCKKISLYASTGKGSGLLVRIGSADFPAQFSDYANSAAISFVE